MNEMMYLMTDVKSKGTDHMVCEVCSPGPVRLELPLPSALQTPALMQPCLCPSDETHLLSDPSKRTHVHIEKTATTKVQCYIYSLHFIFWFQIEKTRFLKKYLKKHVF